ncbi:MAG: hypothetical protein ACXAC8_16120 [Candidatus Hodarchaeales archaeon]|jgi:hypothetical protein
MSFAYSIFHGLFYTLISTGYLFLLMTTFSPRIWGYQDYPDSIKEKVPPQTKRERTIAGIVALPWLVFIVGFPLASTFSLKAQLEGEIPFEIAFLNVFVLVFFFFISDMVILDWFIISKITPQFVIIPGTEVDDYKDFSHHYKGHAIAVIPIVIVCAVIAGIVVIF